MPIRPEVAGAAEILGIDPLYVANEGKLVAVVAPEAADDALARLGRRRGDRRQLTDRFAGPRPPRHRAGR